MTDEMLSPAQLDAYLRRLGLNTPGPPPTLSALHAAHLQSVPFENLNIHQARPISLALPDIHRKVVQERRGGYCYELNSLFAALLRGLDYEVTLLSARVAREKGTFGPEFDHLALRVVSGGQAYLADVGFGDAFLEPLPLQHGFTRQQSYKTLKLVQEGPHWTYLEDRGGGLEPQYTFTLTPHQIEEFGAMNQWQQTAPESHFTQKPICTRATATGRITLSGQRLITTENGVKSEQELTAADVEQVLLEQFDLRVPEAAEQRRE